MMDATSETDVVLLRSRIEELERELEKKNALLASFAQASQQLVSRKIQDTSEFIDSANARWQASDARAREAEAKLAAAEKRQACSWGSALQIELANLASVPAMPSPAAPTQGPLSPFNSSFTSRAEPEIQAASVVPQPAAHRWTTEIQAPTAEPV